MDGGCYALDCLRLLGGDEPSVTGALADPCPSLPGHGPKMVADHSMAIRLAFPGGTTDWFESSFTMDGEFRADVHVICHDGQVRAAEFYLAHRATSWRLGTEP